MHVETHLMSGDQASLQTLIASREEKCGPGQHEGGDGGYEESCCMKAMVWDTLGDKRGGGLVHGHTSQPPVRSQLRVTAEEAGSWRDQPGFGPSSVHTGWAA